MKKSIKILLLAAIVTIIIGCSAEEDCGAKKQQIRDHYENQIQSVKDNPTPNGVDWAQITLIQQERDRKLAEACN